MGSSDTAAIKDPQPDVCSDVVRLPVPPVGCNSTSIPITNETDGKECGTLFQGTLIDSFMHTCDWCVYR